MLLVTATGLALNFLLKMGLRGIVVVMVHHFLSCNLWNYFDSPMVLLNLKLISASHMNAALLWAVYTQRQKTIHVNRLRMWQLVRTYPIRFYHGSLDSFDVFEA